MSGSDAEDHHKDECNIIHNKRPLLSKYATNTAPSSIPLTGDFDKNLTIEKAKFESGSTQQPTTSISTPISPPPLPDSNKEAKSPPLTTSVATLQSLSNNAPPLQSSNSMISAMPSQSTPLLKSKPKNEDRRSIKRKKLPPMSGTATPSEVFHRNLVDAVSNVEDSDENEQYVYPYSGNNTDTTYHVNSTDNTLHRTTSSLHRPQSTRSFINQEPKRGASTGILGEFLRPILFKSKSDSRAVRNSGDEQYRPKLRNYVMDHPFNQTKVNNNEWLEHPPSPRKKKLYTNFVGDGGYTTDDEEAQHLLVTPRRSQQRKKSNNICSRWIRNIFVGLIATFILFFILITYLAKPLRHLDVEMGRVLSSDKELIFDLHLRAINSNLWTVHVADADISVFAFSQVVPMSDTQGVDPAEYLGGFYRFDEPLSFTSSFYSNEPVTAISQIRIKSPGADKSGNERWSRIIRYPYGLVVRGVLKYKPIPFLTAYPQSVAICDVVRVNPTTGKVSEDPDQGFCLSYGSNHTTTTVASF